jgi:predicted HTH transcriptional regulator
MTKNKRSNPAGGAFFPEGFWPASGGKADLAKVPISELIKQAEGPILEFKETLIYDTKQNRKSDDVLLSSLKTIAGFLNTGGGTLLIGVVNNSGEIKGIERDLRTMKHGNNDRFELKIRNCLKERFKPQPIGKVNISFEKFTEGTICRVDVQANKEIVHLDDEVYVRDGNTTQKLEGRPLTDWFQQRGK